MAKDEEFGRSMPVRALLGGLTFTALVMIVWSVADEILPPGWWIFAMDAIGVVFTAVMVLTAALPVLRGRMPAIVVGVVSGVMWYVMFVVLRTTVGLFFQT